MSQAAWGQEAEAHSIMHDSDYQAIASLQTDLLREARWRNATLDGNAEADEVAFKRKVTTPLVKRNLKASKVCYDDRRKITRACDACKL